MRSRPPFRGLSAASVLSVCAFTAVCVLASCSEDDTATPSGTNRSGGASAASFQAAAVPTASVAADAGKLMPSDAVGVVRIRSIDGLENKVKDLVKAFKPGMEGMVNVSPLLQMIGLRPGQLDSTGAVTVALRMTPGGPAPTFILPLNNADEAADITPMPATASGKFVGIGMPGAEPPTVGAGTPALAQDLTDSDLSIRLDLAAILSTTRPLLDKYLDDAKQLIAMNSPQPDPAGGAAVGSMFGMVKSCLDSAKALDLDLSLDGGALNFGFSFDAGGTLGLASDSFGIGAIGLARMLPDAAPAIVELGEGRFDKLIDLILPFYRDLGKSMPGDLGDQLVDMLQESKTAYALLDGGFAVAMNFGPNQPEGTMLLGSSDPAGLVKGLQELLDSYPAAMRDAVVVSKAEPSNIDGLTFTTQTMKFDMAKLMALQGQQIPPEMLAAQTQAFESMFGADGLKFSMAVHEGLVLITMGDLESMAPALVASVKAGGTRKNTILEAAISKLRVKPNLFFSMDLRKMMQQMGSLMKNLAPTPMPPVPAGDPIVIWMGYGEKDGRHVGQLHIDLLGIAALARSWAK